VGAFIAGDETKFRWIFFALGAVIFLVVVIVSFSSYNFSGSYMWTGWWANYGGLVLFILIVGGVITAVVLGNRGK
jgi:hypothetical protein